MERPIANEAALPAAAANLHATVADAAFRRVAWRLIPFLQLCFVVASMDRINVSFAKAQLSRDLALSDAMYGLGAGLFFIGYVLVEVPSNLILHRVGARKWLARIMVSWGIVSTAMAFVESATGFYVLRFLLGVAEAGFAPGVMLYLTQWLPAHRRGRLLAIFLTSLAFSGFIVAPVTGWILGHTDGVMGFKAWQWMFVLESLPAIALGIAALKLLPDSPRTVAWLDDLERAAVLRELAADERPGVEARLGVLLRHSGVWLFGLAYFMLGVGVFGITFWLPTILNLNRLLTPMESGLISAGPYAAAVVGMLMTGTWADRLAPGRVFLTVTAVGAVALGCSGLLLGQFVPLVLALMLAAAGVFSGVPVFWRACTPTMRGVAAAGGIAVVNSIGSLAGFAGPALVGALKQASGGMVVPIVAIAALVLMSSIPLRLAIKGSAR